MLMVYMIMFLVKRLIVIHWATLHNISALDQNGEETCKQLKKPESKRVRNEELIATKNHMRSFITISSQATKINAKMSLYNLKTRKVASKEED